MPSTAYTLDTPTVVSAKGGDTRALRRMYDVLAPAVLGYARGQGVEDPDALANEALYRALSALASFEGDAASFRSWVFTIAHNLIVDDRRRRSRRPTSVPLDHVRARPDGSFVADAALDRVEVTRTLGWIAELTPDQRSVVLLRLVSDLPIDEVARIVGKSPGAVKALHRRGLAALRRRIVADDTHENAAEGVSPSPDATFTPVP
ncbi:MAG: RNA polymerase sigma factor [Acidimicrobiales bacterium]